LHADGLAHQYEQAALHLYHHYHRVTVTYCMLAAVKGVKEQQVNDLC
jgi:hypothetical protein